MKHPHFDYITKWIEDTSATAVMCQAPEGFWELQSNPEWNPDKHYWICAARHVSVTLARLNHGIRLEQDFQGKWVDMEITPTFQDAAIRVKPKTINIGGYEVPEPLRKSLPKGGTYWEVALYAPDSPRGYTSAGDIQQLWLCHATKEAAITHGHALASLTKPE